MLAAAGGEPEVKLFIASSLCETRTGITFARSDQVGIDH